MNVCDECACVVSIQEPRPGAKEVSDVAQMTSTNGNILEAVQTTSTNNNEFAQMASTNSKEFAQMTSTNNNNEFSPMASTNNNEFAQTISINNNTVAQTTSINDNDANLEDFDSEVAGLFMRSHNTDWTPATRDRVRVIDPVSELLNLDDP